MDRCGTDPMDVFGAITNSTRIEILQALANAYGESPNDPWVEYTELQDVVGIRDNGNFNYHLGQLNGFIVKGSPGYRLSRVGMKLLSTVAAGVFDSDWTWGPIVAPGTCPFCDASVELYYEDGTLWLTCGTDAHELGLSVSPTLLETQPTDDIIERIAFLENRWGELIRRGICSECQGRVEGRIESGGIQPDHYHYHGECHHCGFHHGIPVGQFLLSHPTVQSFYHDHGVDILSRPFWTLDWCTPGTETVISSEPLRLRVSITYGEDALSLTVDRNGSIVETTRS